MLSSEREKVPEKLSLFRSDFFFFLCDGSGELTG